MAKDKAPAYQWYPKDYDTDEAVKLMTYEQEGIYRRLLDHQALHGSIPADVRQIALLVPKVSPARFMKLWPAFSEKFPIVDGGRRLNVKLDQVMGDSAAYFQNQEKNGAAGAAARWGRRKTDSTANSTANGTAIDSLRRC